MYIYTHIYVYMYIYIYTYIHTYIYTYIYTLPAAYAEQHIAAHQDPALFLAPSPHNPRSSASAEQILPLWTSLEILNNQLTDDFTVSNEHGADF